MISKAIRISALTCALFGGLSTVGITSAFAANWSVSEDFGNISASGSGFTPNGQINFHFMDTSTCNESNGPWNCVNDSMSSNWYAFADQNGSFNVGGMSDFCHNDNVYWIEDVSSGWWYTAGWAFYGPCVLP